LDVAAFLPVSHWIPRFRVDIEPWQALPTHPIRVVVAAEFNLDVVKAAIREAQALVPGYTYKGFCDKIKRAGCAGYLVSFPGHRVLYFGRCGETHTEYFPVPTLDKWDGVDASPDRATIGSAPLTPTR
jgi:hypothetical protein